MTNTPQHDRLTEYLLHFLVPARVISGEQAFRLLQPMILRKGAGKKSPASSFRTSNVRNLLSRLVRERVLRKWQDAYLLGPQAVPILEAGREYPDKVAKRIRWRAKSSYPESGTVEHDLLITQFLVVLDLARQLEPDRWEYAVRLHGDEPKLRVNGRNTKYDKLVWVLDRSRNLTFYYLIEADRGTAALETSIPHKRNVRERAVKFYEFLRDGGFPKHFGIPGCRLLFIVPAGRRERRDNIQAMVKRIKEIPTETNVFRYTTAEPWMLTEPLRITKWLADVK